MWGGGPRHVRTARDRWAAWSTASPWPTDLGTGGPQQRAAGRQIGGREVAHDDGLMRPLHDGGEDAVAHVGYDTLEPRRTTSGTALYPGYPHVLQGLCARVVSRAVD